MNHKTHVVVRGGVLFTIKPFPAKAPNPGRFRWAVYRDGFMAGAAKDLATARAKIDSGWFDPEQPKETTK